MGTVVDKILGLFDSCETFSAQANYEKLIAQKYCRRLMRWREYNAITFQAEFYQRTQEALMHGLKPVVLYFGDFDPSGVNMFESAIQILEDELES